MIQYPNKTFVADFKNHVGFGITKHVIIIAAKDEETAQNYLEDKYGIRPLLIWLMDCNHKTMYDQTGTKELKPQAKILYSTHS